MYVIEKSDVNVLERPFSKMGARIRFEELRPDRWNSDPAPVRLDVRSDKDGEYFLVSKTAEASLQILEARPEDRHLLLLTRSPGAADREIKARFLLGHDERHWFVAAIPEQTPVSTVTAAKQALKPAVVVARERDIRVRTRDRRANKARIRQGEWFFIPLHGVRIDLRRVLRNEPLRRGRGKPHVCQELYREGGEIVWVHPRYPNGMTSTQYRRLSEKVRAQTGWRTMARNPRVFVRGTVRHSDHKTIHLPGWHEVFMNTETRAAAMRNVAFLD